GAREPHALEHVARPHAAVHHVEVLDVDAVDALVKPALLVTVEARRDLAQVARQALDPEVAGFDDVSVGIGQLGDWHLMDPPGGGVRAPTATWLGVSII